MIPFIENTNAYFILVKLNAEEGQGKNSTSQPFPVGPSLLNNYPDLIGRL